jgi:hypothetical protein
MVFVLNSKKMSQDLERLIFKRGIRVDKVIPFRPRKKVITLELKNKAIIPLWDLSQQVDEMIRKALLENRLTGEEVAAILANRLGNLIREIPDKEKLKEFCLKIIEKETGKNVS